MNRTARLIVGFLAAGALGTAVAEFSVKYSPRTLGPVPRLVAPPPPPSAFLAALKPVTETISLKSGDTLAGLLSSVGVNTGAEQEMISAAREAFDLRKLRSGAKMTLTRSGSSGAVQSLEYVIDPDHRLDVSREAGAYRAEVVDVPGTIRRVPVCTTLEDSLFVSIEKTGAPAELALRMADIFAWDLDFYTDPREGDQFCLLVEKKQYSNGQPPAYRTILAAQYRNAGTLYDAYLFPDQDGKPRYFSRTGRSLQAAFLKSPLKFAAPVSSHFSMHRFHPILKLFRPHLGTDYAAPTGTPVQAIAAGKVVFSGFSGGSGNLITIAHNGGYVTQYMHLSKRLVHAGENVGQGERIGLVGATGLATGPHLDFRVRKNGKYMDFEHLRLPRGTAVAANRMKAFTAQRDRDDALFKASLQAAVH
jgi:murein DD-endopeptidase MepM/ murein hydrolase activator NlpD